MLQESEIEMSPKDNMKAESKSKVIAVRDGNGNEGGQVATQLWHFLSSKQKYSLSSIENFCPTNKRFHCSLWKTYAH
jgi:hypothetical protein